MRPTKRICLAVAVAALWLGACNTSINAPIDIADGETSAGDLNTVNGSISLGRESHVRGSCRSVNGNVELDDGARASGVATVNGTIRIGADAVIEGDAESVNGRVSTRAGCTIKGDVSTVNGSIDLRGTRVEDNIHTVNGRVSLQEQSVVGGDVVIKDQVGGSRKPLEIEISGGSVVEGDVINEDDDLTVRVYLSGGGKILGRTENVEVIQDQVRLPKARGAR
ncbi:MAG: hypothetical protein GY716_21365 [bacterium]|nr:hypothetical protein [bacterium]